MEICQQVLEENICSVFTLFERGGHLSHVTQIPFTHFHFPTEGGSTQNLALAGQAVREKKMFEIVNGRTDAGAFVYHLLTW